MFCPSISPQKQRHKIDVWILAQKWPNIITCRAFSAQIEHPSANILLAPCLKIARHKLNVLWFSPPQNLGSQVRCLDRKSKRPYMISLSLSLLEMGRGCGMSGASTPLFFPGYKDNDLTPMVFVPQMKWLLYMSKSTAKRLYISFALPLLKIRCDGLLSSRFSVSILLQILCMFCGSSCLKNSKQRLHVGISS
jgi:hypothetical protein